jgi:hypothetical protein
MKHRGFMTIGHLISLSIIVFLAGCTTFNHLMPTPSPTIDPKIEAENGFTNFMQIIIIEIEIVPFQENFQVEHVNVPGSVEPLEEFIILKSPIVENYQALNPQQWLDTKNVYAAWLYNGSQIVPQENAENALANYQQQYMNVDPGIPSEFIWGYYEFGFVSISEDFRTAEVYLHATCGSQCGNGILFTLIIDDHGEYSIDKYKVLWSF